MMKSGKWVVGFDESFIDAVNGVEGGGFLDIFCGCWFG